MFTLTELEQALTPHHQETRGSRTVAGKAILANKSQITTTSAALLLLIDERLKLLRQELPNSGEATSLRDQTIEQYEQLKRELVAFRQLVFEFREGSAKEREMVKASKSFAEGVGSWWTKSHERICDKALDMSLFLSAVGVCSMAGSGGQLAVVVSAALVGGKPIANVLKEISKKAFKHDL